LVTIIFAFVSFAIIKNSFAKYLIAV